MAKKYVWIRVRKEDFEKIVKTKREPIEQDLKTLTGKNIKIKNTQLFKIAANSTWDLGNDFAGKIVGAVKLKKGDIKW